MPRGAERLPRENAERGLHNGGRAPYGYRRKVTEERGRSVSRLVPGPANEVATVQRLFDLMVNHGYGNRRLARLLNEEGVPGPTGRPWRTSSVNSVLKNPVYAGDVVWRRTKKVGRTGRTKTTAEERTVTRDAHEALVPRALFDERQKLAKQRNFTDRVRKKPAIKYLLSGLIHCSSCGARFTRRRSVRSNVRGEKRVYLNYYCGGCLARGPSVCRPVRIQVDWLEGLVADVLRDWLCSPGMLDELEQRIHDRIEGRRKASGSDAARLEEQLADLDRRIANCYRAIGDGLDLAMCQQHIAALTATREKIEAELLVFQQEDYHDRAKQQNLSQLRQFAAAFRDGFLALPFGKRRRILEYFIERIEVVDHAVVRIHFRVPFDHAGITILTEDVRNAGEDPAGEAENQDAGVEGVVAGPIWGATEPLEHEVRATARRPPERETARPTQLDGTTAPRTVMPPR